MTLTDIQKQIDATMEHVQKVLLYLEFSLKKIDAIPENFDVNDYDLLEVYESFTSRFARLSDIVATKLLRSLVLKDDPSFRGGFMDLLNQAEKLKLISDARTWWVVRSLRSKEAHDYTDDCLKMYFKSIKIHARFILDETKILLKKI